jgi:hypothetical protein
VKTINHLNDVVAGGDKIELSKFIYLSKENILHMENISTFYYQDQLASM